MILSKYQSEYLSKYKFEHLSNRLSQLDMSLITNKQPFYFPDDIFHLICQYCDRYQVRVNHQKICLIISRIGMTRRVMTKDWAGPFEDEFIEWWDSITILYHPPPPTNFTHSRVEPLDSDSCLSLPPNEYYKYSRQTGVYDY